MALNGGRLFTANDGTMTDETNLGVDLNLPNINRNILILSSMNNRNRMARFKPDIKNIVQFGSCINIKFSWTSESELVVIAQ